MSGNASAGQNWFDRGGSAYALFRPDYPDELSRFLSYVSPAQSLAVDVGCGTGQLTRQIARHFGSVIGIDNSADQIAHAPPQNGVEYHCASAEDLPVRNNCVDLVTVAQATHWFDRPAFYRECRRVAVSNTVIALISYGVLRIASQPHCLPDRSNYSFRALALDQVGLMHQLGYDRFHLIGHDRGGRTGHRMALDHPQAVLSLMVLDIVPTFAMFMDTNRRVAGAYWHWYFLSQPEPFPETMIGGNPDVFYETCLFGWGAASLSDFDAPQLAEYRRCWRTSEMIHGSCSDYRAAATIDLDHDQSDIGRKVECPTLVFYGSAGHMAKLFDMPEEWSKRFANMAHASLPGGHFFPDQFPRETSDELIRFLGKANARGTVAS